MLLKRFIFITSRGPFFLLCRLFSRAPFSHGGFPFLNTRAVNCSSFELLHFSLWWLTVISEQIAFESLSFYWFTSHGTNNVRDFFRTSLPEVLYSNSFFYFIDLFFFFLFLSLSFSGNLRRRSEPVLISVPFLAEARILRYCTLDVLRTAGDTDRQTDSTNGTSLPRSHATARGCCVVHCYRIPFPVDNWATLQDVLDSPKDTGWSLV
jgi:hypothetical protein